MKRVLKFITLLLAALCEDKSLLKIKRVGGKAAPSGISMPPSATWRVSENLRDLDGVLLGVL